MKILLLNGSPKSQESNSGNILAAIEKRLPDGIAQTMALRSSADWRGVLQSMSGCDALVFSFPLYVDGIPSHLLRFLDEQGDAIAAAAPNARVYAVANNGFYEGAQTALALAMMESFAVHTGLAFGGGCGIGGGEMSSAAAIGKGPLTSWGKTLDVLCEAIIAGKAIKNQYVTPNFPRRLYMAAASMTFRARAKKNGVRL
jgi:multimeric flavodoxin WrbA